MKAEIWNHKTWIKETDPNTLKTRFGLLLGGAGFNIVSFVEHHFKPQGYTALWLLSESHFAIHTFPEHGRAYLELSSCNLDFFKRFLDLLEVNE